MFLFRDSATFYYNLGVACLYVGDFGGAFSYLKRAQQLSADDTAVLIGLAAIHLRRRQVAEALQCWLQVLDVQPKNATARRGLALVRATTDQSDYATMAESGRLRRFYPGLGFRLPRWLVVTAATALLAAAAILLWQVIADREQPPTPPTREGADLTTTPSGTDGLTDFSAEFRYVLTEREIQDSFDRIGDYFNEFRDNMAQREVNLLLNSNASQVVKERALLVAGYFAEPTFVNFSDNFEFADVAAEPWLYDQCYVRWSGQASNVSSDADEITFTFLVGYEEELVLDGTIAVRLAFAAELEAGPIELIGRLHYEHDRLFLTATSIRRLARDGGS